MINLVPSIKASMQVDRLFLRDTDTVELQNNEGGGWETIHILKKDASTGHWTVSEKNTSWTSRTDTRKYLVLEILDEAWTREIVLSTEAVIFQNRRYKVSADHPPLLGSEPIWELKLEFFEWLDPE